MEQAIYQRIMLVLEDKQVTVNSLSKTIEMAQTTLNTQLKGERSLAANVVGKILNAFSDVSAEWIMRGKGEMYTADSYRNTPMPDAVAMPLMATDPVQAKEEDSIWKAKYEELEKRYDQLLSILGGGMKQANVG